MSTPKIQKIKGTITKVRDLTPTAKELTITPSAPFAFTAGNFVNLFLPYESGVIRRAYSLSSSDQKTDTCTVSVRYNPAGDMTPLFWQRDYTGEEVEIMGPLGLNTADKMNAPRVFLFGFGIGAGVVKSIAQHLATKPSVIELVIMTGSRNEHDIVHRDYFDTLAHTNPHVRVTYILSNPETTNDFPQGYIQDNLDGFNFSDSAVYICGQDVACDALQKRIVETNPTNCQFLIESFG